MHYPARRRTRSGSTIASFNGKSSRTVPSRKNARDRIEDTAYRLPVSPGREEMLGFKQPYDVATEMWQALAEAVPQLDELIERIEAAARVSAEELAGEFPELPAAAAAG